MTYSYETTGTCSSRINFELTDGKIHRLSFEDGCNGNLKALGILTEGMDAAEIAEKLKGLKCGARDTSCADQLARAITKAMVTKSS
jgi:uncharacterized protein (TIGR03905 family)